MRTRKMRKKIKMLIVEILLLIFSLILGLMITSVFPNKTHFTIGWILGIVCGIPFISFSEYITKEITDLNEKE